MIRYQDRVPPRPAQRRAREYDEGVAAARGILLGILIGAAFWAVVFILIEVVR